MIRVHHHDAAHTLALLLGGVHDVAASGQRAGVDTEERQLADERVNHDLERQRGERLAVRGVTNHFLFGVMGVSALDGGDVQRAGHVLDDVVQQRLHALVAVRSAAADGVHGAVDGGLADGVLDFFLGEFLALEELFHQHFVGLGDLLDHFGVILLRQFHHVGRNFFLADVLAFIVVVDLRLHLHKVDDAAEIIFSADGQLNRNCVGVQTLLHHVHHAEEVRAGDVHLVHIRHARNMIGFGLLPHGFGLGLNAALSAEDAHSAVQHAQGTFNLNGEVNVTGGVDNVNTIGAILVVGVAGVAPAAGGGGGGDGDTTLLLLHHPVHGGRALMGFTDAVHTTGVEQNTFRGGRLAGVDVRHDTNVAHPLKGMTARHMVCSFQQRCSGIGRIKRSCGGSRLAHYQR